MYNSLRSDIYSVFSTTDWTTLNIKAYPDNYQGAISTTDSFVKISIITGSASLDAFSFGKQLSGMLIISIFVKAGNGDKDVYTLADTLDGFFEGKTLQNGTQFGPSTIKYSGLDRDDPSLYRGDYSITFKTFGD